VNSAKISSDAGLGPVHSEDASIREEGLDNTLVASSITSTESAGMQTD
jgi:hypothetical protein